MDEEYYRYVPLSNKSLSDLEKTSDRFKLSFSSSRTPAEIPVTAITRLVNLRNEGFIPKYPKTIIINTHSELVIKPEDLLSSASEISNLLRETSTSGGFRVKWEPTLEILDFYAFYPDLEISQRVRYYFQNNLLSSARIITADISPRQCVYWKYNDLKIPARSEHVYVIRESENGQAAKTINPNTDSFIAINKYLYAIVFKHVVRGNFGNSRMWDHRKAVYKNGDEKETDATCRHAVLGMGPYIAFSIQEVQKAIFSGNVNTLKIRKEVEKIKSNKISPKECYQTMSDGVSEPEYTIIEIECRGEENRAEGAFIYKQVGDRFTEAKINYSILEERKICKKHN